MTKRKRRKVTNGRTKDWWLGCLSGGLEGIAPLLPHDTQEKVYEMLEEYKEWHAAMREERRGK